MAGPGRESGRTDPPPSADGKLYDAYISYSDSPEDRKFVNFILKPQLERHRGYKLFLDDRDLLPRAGTGAPPLSAWAPPLLLTDPASQGPAPQVLLSPGPAPRALRPFPLGPTPVPVLAPPPLGHRSCLSGPAPQVSLGPRPLSTAPRAPAPPRAPPLQGPVCAAPADARVLQSRRQTSW